MVGAQNAMNIASNFLPLRKSTSETTIIDKTTSSNKQFIAPTRLIKFLIITVIRILLKVTNYFKTMVFFVKFFLTFYELAIIIRFKLNIYKLKDVNITHY